MAGDPNARRDKALENIARSLEKTVDLLSKIERNTRPPRPSTANHPYLESESGKDASAGTEPYSDPQSGPYGSGTTDPYG